MAKTKISGEKYTSVFAPIADTYGNMLAVYSISLASDDIKAIKKMARENAEQYYLDAAMWYAQAADAGHTGAQYELGSMYENGDGVKKDYSKAIEYFTCLAEAGETRPQYDLAVCYANSADTADNRAQSAKWYKEAANNGNGNAQYVIGECYYKGHGVEKDYPTAVQWWRTAAEAKRKAEEKQRQAEAERRLIASAVRGYTYHGSDGCHIDYGVGGINRRGKEQVAKGRKER